MAGKDPSYVSKLVLKNSGVMETETGTEIVSVDSTGTPSIKANIEDALADGKIYVGSAAGVTSEVAMSGDVTIVNSGATTIGAGKVSTNEIEGLADGEMIIGVDGTPANNAKVVVGGDITIANDGTAAVNWLGANAQASSNVGTPGTNVNVVESGDSYNHVTVLNFSNLALPGPSGAAAEALGYKLYEFPAGSHVHEVTAFGIALQGGGVVDADTPDVGIGSVIGTGAVSVLGGTATFEDYVTGQTFTDCNGTTENVGPLGATAGALTGISLNGAADVKDVFLNYADTWAGADTLEATGGVVLKWTSLPTGP